MLHASHFTLQGISGGEIRTKSQLLFQGRPRVFVCLTHLVVFCYSASQDNIRLWKVSDETLSDPHRRGVPFKIIAGHHGGVISNIRES